MLNEFHDLHRDLEVFHVHTHDHHHVSSDQFRANIDAHQRIHNDAMSDGDLVYGHIRDLNHDLRSNHVSLLLHSDALHRAREVQQRIYDRGDACARVHLCGRMDHLRIQYHVLDDDYVNNVRQARVLWHELLDES